MKTAKKHNKIFAIICTIVSAIFAIYVGVTYCAETLTLQYGTNPNSTSAYLANQQYHLVNDTINNPIVYGEGVHNFEIALEYAMPYDFDVKITYSFTCSDDNLKDKVILNFTNRDNIIYDEKYIFLANPVQAGDGKITIINGVEFADVDDETLLGDTLQINATVQICKTKTSYDANNHTFKPTDNTKAFSMWIYHKNKADTSNNYVLMYNYRNDFNHGVAFPGLNSAYKKTLSGQSIETASWAGGNRAYAGVGMYVVTGNKGLTLDVLVGGQWRNSNDTQETENLDGKLISENCIKFNYTSEWEKSGYDTAKLWEVRDYCIGIPAQTSCYIQILDSIEITRASVSNPNMTQDYRAVVQKIQLHSKQEGKMTKFTYEEIDASNSKIQLQQIKADTPQTAISGTFASENISVVNNSIYNPGLYTSDTTTGHNQDFQTSVIAINNTNKTQKITAQYKIYYLFSNAQEGFYNNADDKLRVDEVITSGEEGKDLEETRFASTYTYSITEAYSSTKITISDIIIAPYSSANIIDEFTVGLDLQTSKLTIGNYRYDAWVFVVVESISTVEVNSNPITSINLQVETKLSGNTVHLYVKNNTNKMISNITSNNFRIYELEVYYTAIGNEKPADWVATYWKHYKDLNGETQNNSSTFDTGITYYLKSQTYENITPNSLGLSGLTLNPGESKMFATATMLATSETSSAKTFGTKKIMLAGTISGTATDSDAAVLLEEGTGNARIYNPTESTSFYVRFKGTLNSKPSNIKTYGNYNYYIGILRPGQILNIPMSEMGTVAENENQFDAVIASGDFNKETTFADFNSKNLPDWNSNAVNDIAKYFALIKS